MMFLRHFAIWSVLCWLSAGPSFFFGLGATSADVSDIIAMSLGIFIFALAYALVSGLPVIRKARRRPFIRRTMFIGYGTRLLISFFYPFGWVLDLYCGSFSSEITKAMFGSLDSFIAVLATTLVQGTVLNSLLFIYMVIVFAFQKIFMTERLPYGRCLKCDYDLTGNRSGICPECGQVATTDS